MKAIELPRKQWTKKFGWLHHYGSCCTDVGATTLTLNVQELFTKLKLVCLKPDIGSLNS